MDLHPSVLSHFCQTQAQLMAALASAYPETSFSQPALSLPREGQVAIEGAIWTFQRHGAGLRFTNVLDGRVVDMHEDLPRSDVIDAWRLLQFLESQGVYELEFEAVTEALSAAAKRLKLRAIGDRKYELPIDRRTSE